MEEKKKILIVEDDETLNEYVSSQLKLNDYDTVQCLTAQDAYNALATDLFDLVLLDLNLGEANGMDILHFIRSQNKIIPVMIVSSTKDDSSKVLGFREGCDDYMTKPFYVKELLLRVKRMLDRLSYLSFEKKSIKSVYEAGIFSVDMNRRVLLKDGVEVTCRKRVFDLAAYFIQNANSVHSFAQIYENVWHEPAPTDEAQLNSNLYANIYALRNLIEEDPKNPKYVVSVNKTGYMLVAE